MGTFIGLFENGVSLLTQLDVTDPDALFAFLQDLLKVDAGKAAGAARHQHCCHAHKLRPSRGGLLLRGHGGIRRPLWEQRQMPGFSLQSPGYFRLRKNRNFRKFQMFLQTGKVKRRFLNVKNTRGQSDNRGKNKKEVHSDRGNKAENVSDVQHTWTRPL